MAGSADAEPVAKGSARPQTPRAYRATGHAPYRAQAMELLQALGRLDPWLFDDDPDDAGKRYLAPFVHLLRAQDLLIRGGAKSS